MTIINNILQKDFLKRLAFTLRKSNESQLERKGTIINKNTFPATCYTGIIIHLKIKTLKTLKKLKSRIHDKSTIIVVIVQFSFIEKWFFM